jgi:hypothetical protein
MSQDYSIETDVNEAEAMVKGFENYLKSNEVYGSVRGGFFGFGQMPSLTAGALAMRLRRLDVLHMQLDGRQRERLAVAVRQHEAICAEWPVHYERKLLREANSRLDTMRHYFSEVGGGQDAVSAYKPEQLRRTIVQEILTVMTALNIESADLDTKVRYIDDRLQGIALEHSDFLWAEALEPAYPEKDYWWLYRQPRARR